MGTDPKENRPSPDGVNKDGTEKIERELNLAREQVGGTSPSSTSRDKKLREHIAELQESLDDLRLSMKYALFDTEATRRENAALLKENEELWKQLRRLNPGSDAPEGDRD
jgi:DNA repair exonuclease SbcCD ATPase subunit